MEKNVKIGKRKVEVEYPRRKKKFRFSNIFYELFDYKEVNYAYIKFKKYDRFDKEYSHTVDVSELLYNLQKRKKLNCNRLILFDFDKNNNLLGIEIINL